MSALGWQFFLVSSKFSSLSCYHIFITWYRFTVNNVLCVKFLGGITFAAHVIPSIPAHFSLVWSVGRLSHSCTCLNGSTDLDAIVRYTCGIQWDIVLDGVPDPPGKEKIWGSNPSAKTCNCKLLLPPAEYKRAIPPFTKLLLALFYVCYHICYHTSSA